MRDGGAVLSELENKREASVSFGNLQTDAWTKECLCEVKNLKSLNVALVVPRRRKRKNKRYKKSRLKRMCLEGDIDLVVHDEVFFDGRLEEAQETVGEYAQKLGVPVLSGFRSDEGLMEGFMAAVYANPK